MKKLKINFILPFKPRRPAGGFRVMYEYANQLAKKGYQVHLTYPIKTPYMKYRFPYLIRKIITQIERFKKDKWFSFDPSITMSYIPYVKNKFIEDADIIITTWWATVLEVSKLSEQKGKKINLIQGYENWEGHEDLLLKSYNLPNIENITVSKYLNNIIKQQTGKNPTIIPNAISSDVFQLKIPITDRSRFNIIMTYSEQEIKGSKYGLEALKKVKNNYPELRVDLFGVYPEPNNLPSWITYHRNPNNLVDLYNNSSIILSNSFTEGFPLTPAEGMFCGCALICTDIDGHKEYAIDKQTALLVPTKDSEILAKKIMYLIDNEEERINIAQRGNQYIQQYEWRNSISKMENKILELVKGGQY